MDREQKQRGRMAMFWQEVEDIAVVVGFLILTIGLLVAVLLVIAKMGADTKERSRDGLDGTLPPIVARQADLPYKIGV